MASADVGSVHTLAVCAAIRVSPPFRVVRHRFSSSTLCMGSPSVHISLLWIQYPRRWPHGILPGGFRTTAPGSLDTLPHGTVIRNPYMSATLSRPFFPSVPSLIPPCSRIFFRSLITLRIQGLLVACLIPFFCSTAPQAFFRPDRNLPGHRAQRRSMTAPLGAAGRLVIDGREHDGTLDDLGPGSVALYTPVDFYDVECVPAGPASMSIGACDNRITLYPAAPLRLATLLYARTIAREGWGHLHSGRLATPNLQWGSPATHPTRPNAPTWRSVGTASLSSCLRHRRRVEDCALWHQAVVDVAPKSNC